MKRKKIEDARKLFWDGNAFDIFIIMYFIL